MARHVITLSLAEIAHHLKNALSSKLGQSKITITPLVSTYTETVDPIRGDYVTLPRFDGIELAYEE